jgi:hypothetical protein
MGFQYFNWTRGGPLLTPSVHTTVCYSIIHIVDVFVFGFGIVAIVSDII